MRKEITSFVAAGLFAATMGSAKADSYNVFVGYADDLRASPNFPNPWIGSSGVTFDGLNESVSGFHFDSGAIMVQNTGTSDLTLDAGAKVTMWNGTTYQLWNSNAGQVIHPGQSLILTQPGTSESFDSSDSATFQPNGVPATTGVNAPKVTLSFNGLSNDYLDTGHILDTGGFDTAFNGSNESLGWRLIGTTDSTVPQNQIPDTGSTAMLLGGALGAVSFLRRKLSA